MHLSTPSGTDQKYHKNLEVFQALLYFLVECVLHTNWGSRLPSISLHTYFRRSICISLDLPAAQQDTGHEHNQFWNCSTLRQPASSIVLDFASTAHTPASSGWTYSALECSITSRPTRPFFHPPQYWSPFLNFFDLNSSPPGTIPLSWEATSSNVPYFLFFLLWLGCLFLRTSRTLATCPLRLRTKHSTLGSGKPLQSSQGQAE